MNPPSTADGHPNRGLSSPGSNLVRGGAALAEALDLAPKVGAMLDARTAGFPVRATRHYLSLIDKADPHDPLLLQILPTVEEGRATPGFVRDPVGDQRADHHRAPALVHKYPGRALLILTGACAIHCRYCFRRHFPYEEVGEGGRRWAAALKVIAEDTSIVEVILSGGDPLSLGDAALGDLVEQIAAIPHVRRLRIHSRVPVVDPEQVTDGLARTLGGTRLSAIFVTHFNHARELHPLAVAACDRLRRAGLPVLNQSVLLRGVNDSVESFVALCEALADAAIVPYYLHLLDPVAGAAHFEVGEEQGRALIEAARSRLPGWAVPRLVRDTGAGPAKRLIA